MIMPVNAYEMAQINTFSSSIYDYLSGYTKTYTDEKGNVTTFSYNLDNMSEEELEVTIDYISEIGISTFETEATAHFDRLWNESLSSRIETRADKTVYANMTEGNNVISDIIPVFLEIEDDAVEYIEVLGFTAVVTNGNITNMTRLNFNIENTPAGCSYVTNAIDTFFNDSTALIMVEYTITKDLNIPDFLPLIKWTTDRDTSLMAINLS